MTLQIRTDCPILVIIRGLPGSGKSYLAAALRDTIGERVELLDPDAVNLDDPDFRAYSDDLTRQDVDAKFHVYRYVRDKAYQAIKDRKILVWNQPFTDLDGLKTTVARLQTYAQDHDLPLPLLVAEVEIDARLAHDRVVQRKQQGGHGPDDERFERFVDQYHSFAAEGFATVAIQGGGDVTNSVGTILSALASIDTAKQ